MKAFKANHFNVIGNTWSYAEAAQAPPARQGWCSAPSLDLFICLFIHILCHWYNYLNGYIWKMHKHTFPCVSSEPCSWAEPSGASMHRKNKTGMNESMEGIGIGQLDATNSLVMDSWSLHWIWSEGSEESIVWQKRTFWQFLKSFSIRKI